MVSDEKEAFANRVAVRGEGEATVRGAAVRKGPYEKQSPFLREHDPSWLVEAKELAAVYREVFGELLLAVEHVGSTAVPGLLAKAILDIDLVIPSRDDLPAVIEGLGSIGYSYGGDQGIPGREVFKRVDENVPYSGLRRDWTHHHLYVCARDADELRRHLRFRDVLRSDVEVRDEYQRLKLAIAKRCHGDRKRYAALKEIKCRDFFKRILG